MFRNYTEKAQRVIYFSRLAVSEFGGTSIETEHLLLGLLQEDETLVARFLPSAVTLAILKKQIKERIMAGEKISESIEIPLSSESQKVLSYAADEAKKMSHEYVDTRHLLIGLLRRKNSVAEEILRANAIVLRNVRQELGSSVEGRK